MTIEELTEQIRPIIDPIIKMGRAGEKLSPEVKVSAALLALIMALGEQIRPSERSKASLLIAERLIVIQGELKQMRLYGRG